MVEKVFFTSESVTEGHPDKICDQVSDAFLDEVLRQDPAGRVAVETLASTGLIMVAGEVTTSGYVDTQGIVRKTLREIGYTNPEFGLDCQDCCVLTAIHEQSKDIAVGVDAGVKKEQGAGDQGCLKKGTLVRTKNGFRKIEEIHKGEFVVTPNGIKRILNARMTGRKKLVEVILSNGMRLECTPDHRILCYGRKGETYWKAAGELTAQDFACILKPAGYFAEENAVSHVPREQFFTKYNHRVFGPSTLALDPGVGYLTGELIGDGNVNKVGVMEIAFGNNFAHVPLVQNIAEEAMPGQWRVITASRNTSLKIDSVLVRKHFENFGLKRTKSPQKKTPDALFTSPEPVIKAYLRGLFDSDGTIVINTGRNKSNARIRLSSSSLELLRETQLLMNDFDIKTVILFNRPAGTPVGRDPRYASKYDNYVLNVIGFESFQNFAKEIGFLDPKKTARINDFIGKNSNKKRNSRGIFLIPHPWKKELIDEKRLGKELPFAVISVKSVVEKEEDEVYDLEIQDAHLFSGNGLIVHNSMFGFACSETPELMPLPIMLAHKLARRLAELRKDGTLPWVRPDGKSQVTVEYVDGKPSRVDTVVIAVHHNPEMQGEPLKREIIEKVIKPVCGEWLDAQTKYHVNSTGIFVVGGPEADTGVTGRKIIVDTYGGYARHGGGAFCVSGDSLVNTEFGLAPIRELSSVPSGSLIKTDLSPTPLEQWIDNGELEVLKIQTKDGFCLEGTPNQSIRVVDARGNYVWRRLDGLEFTDAISIQRKNRLFGSGELPEFKFQHKPGTHRSNEFCFPDYLTEDYAYLLGLLTGDGRCTTSDGVQVCVCESQMQQIVDGLFNRLFGKSGKTFGHWAFYCGVELRAYLAHLGLGYWRAWQKKVPSSVFSAPKNVVAAFLRGLFDTDGTIRLTGRNSNSGDIKLTTTSRELALGVQQLLLNLGIVSHIQKVDANGKTSIIRGREVRSARPLYHVRIKGSHGVEIFRKEIGFGLPRKSARLQSIPSAGKRNRLTVPHQIERAKRLWAKLPSTEHQADKAGVGRWLRNPSTKGTKELTYEKLAVFLDTYDARFAGDPDFEYLRTFYVMGHYYTQLKNVEKSKSNVYDFVVPGVHTFTANGFICHNSGKDPSKVDRSGAYACRYIAKNIVAAGLAEKCEVQLAYTIGVAEPVSVLVESFGTNKVPNEKISELVRKHFPLKPADIIKHLQLLRPIYKKTAAYGHFGRDEPEFTWERTDKAEVLRKDAGLA